MLCCVMLLLCCVVLCCVFVVLCCVLFPSECLKELSYMCHCFAADVRLPPPTNLQMRHVSRNTVHLSWDYDNTATPTGIQVTSIRFLVQCKQDRNKFAVASNALNSTEYAFNLLCSGAKYTFRVLAYHAGTVSRPSALSYSFWNEVTGMMWIVNAPLSHTSVLYGSKGPAPYTVV